jgi:hypothetical protein
MCTSNFHKISSFSNFNVLPQTNFNPNRMLSNNALPQHHNPSHLQPHYRQKLADVI